MNEQEKDKITPVNLFEQLNPCNTQAYMLVYIRQDQRDEILLQDEEIKIPENIKSKFDSEAELQNEMQNELEVHVDCGSVMLLSSEIVAANWIEDDRPQVPPDLIED